MKAIQKGDLVMVVKPRLCCGKAFRLGYIFIAKPPKYMESECANCGYVTDAKNEWSDGTKNTVEAERLIRIDPPATGDTLPTRKQMRQPA